MRIEPISLYGSGPNWGIASVSSVPSVSPIVIQRRKEAAEQREKDIQQEQWSSYQRGTAKLAMKMYGSSIQSDR